MHAATAMPSPRRPAPMLAARTAPAQRLRVLVAIASHGTRNDAYLHQLLHEYATMPYDVDVVVLSNIDKAVGPGVELRVGLPARNPWSLPFAHKSVFAERLEQHDLFIYSEDDTLITQHHVAAFLEATTALRPDEIAGFMRSECGPDDTLYYATMHDHYHWDVQSVCRRNGATYAHFTNVHSACYMLTQAQLRRAIASGGYCVAPHEGKYDLLVSAATDPYTQCGLRKLVDISQLDRFTCKHLSNKYVGLTGVPAPIAQLQIDALMAIGQAHDTPPPQIRVEPKLPGTRWIKSYYEPCREDLLALIPPGVTRALSIGCGWGSTEAALVRVGTAVTAVPLDPVIGRVAESHGVAIVACAPEAIGERLAGEQYGAVLISGLLHMIDDPRALLVAASRLLAPGGQLVLSVPNLHHVSVWGRRLARAPSVRHIGDFARSGLHVTSLGRVRRWLDDAGLQVGRCTGVFPPRWARYHRATLGMVGGLWASEYCLAAHRRDDAVDRA